MSLEKLMDWIEKEFGVYALKKFQKKYGDNIQLTSTHLFEILAFERDGIKVKIQELAREELKEVKKSLIPVFDSGQALIYLNEKKEELERVLK